MSSKLYVLGRWAVRARNVVVALWLAVLVLLGVGVLTLSKGLDNSVSIPGTESGDALERLYATFPEVGGSSAQVIIVGPEGSDITAEPVKTIVNDSVAQFLLVEDVEVATPIDDPLMAATISEAGNVALLTVQVIPEGGIVGDATKEQLHEVAATLNQNLPEGYEANVGGMLFAQEFPTISITEVLGVIVALVVLLMTLGTLIGAGLPLMVGLAGVAASTALVFIGTAFATINSTTPLLSVMLSLAVGIDYSLFIVSRHRDNLKQGLPVTESIARSLGTSGSAVVFAGVTVMIALIGLSVAGIPFLTIMGVAGAIGVGLAVIAACTLLPAVLSFVGFRILTKKERAALAPIEDETEDPAPASATQKPNRFFSGWVKTVTAIPALTIGLIVAGLVALSFPALSLQLALPDAGVLPADNEARVTHELVAENFGPGYNGPLIVTAPILTSQDPLGLMADLADEVAQVPGVASIALSTPNQTADTGIIQVVPETDGRSAETAQLVHDIRALHDHFEDVYGVDISVTGQTAVGVDVSRLLTEALLPFALVVVGLSLVLLTIVFRSIAVPIIAVVGYLLSVASAFGVVVLVFEFGFLADLLGVAALGPIINFMPLVTMGILFGLSMDYQVFLVSRIREDYVHTGRARHSVYTGFLGSAKVVTAAAIIMVAVFTAFVPEGDMNLKPIALGLAVGVAIDAFVIRMALIPATMVLLGDRAWWIPRWLDRILPHFDIEGEGVLRERSLESWPENPSSVAVRDFTDANLSFTVDEGGNLFLHGTDGAQLQRTAQILAARRPLDGGTVKVLGYLLPQRAGAVRSRVAYLQANSNEELAELVAASRAERPKMFVIYAGPQVTNLGPLAEVDVPIVAASTLPFDLPGDRWQSVALPTLEGAQS